jgi:outer membrane receptor protein involved in Fe transport
VRFSVTGVLAALAVMAAQAAEAQSSPVEKSATSTDKPAAPAPAKAPPAKAPVGKTVEGVTVTGQSQNGIRTSIDRRSYGVANDLATTTGSISDALRNVPSVDVDVQGNVSLRGDQNVTIMIDGKPSGMFKGPGAAAALQSMPADQIERVEVITNPSAAYSPEGTAGIINLITKTSHRAGKSGSIRLNVGTGRRGNYGMSGAYNSNKLTLSGDANIRFDDQAGLQTDSRTILDGHGNQVAASHQTFKQVGGAEFWNLRGSVDYDVTDKTRLSGEVRVSRPDFQVKPRWRFEGVDANGAPNIAFDALQHSGFARPDATVQGSLRHKFGDDHDIVLFASRERADERRESAVIEAFTLPVQPDLFIDLHTVTRQDTTVAKADYTRPMPGEGKLKAGYDFRLDDNSYDNVGARGLSQAAATPDPSQTNLFLYKQTINGAYATYEQPFGDWTVLGGLRLEDVQLDLNQITTHLVHSSDAVGAYPSLHVGYKVSDNQQLTLSYSRRVQRPNPQDLNPFVSQRDQFNLSSGNPDLKPQITNAFEAAWQYKAGGAFYLATLFYRPGEHGVTTVLLPLANGGTLSTRQNLASSQAAGLELVANGKLTPSLNYQVSTSLFYAEIDGSGIPLGPGLGFAASRSAYTASGRGSLTWQMTPKDTLQFNANLSPKILFPQGFNEAQFQSFLGYRHKFSDKLSGVVTLQDVFNTIRFRQTVDSPVLRERLQFKPQVQAVYLGLAWTFGAAQKRPQTFDFGPGPQ